MGKDPLHSFALRFVCRSGGAKTGLVLLALYATCIFVLERNSPMQV